VRGVREIKSPIYAVGAGLEEPKVIGEDIHHFVDVELVRRPGETVTVGLLRRMIESRHEPDDDLMKHPKFPKDEVGNPVKVRNSMGRLVWCLGVIEFVPLRLGYATSVHRSQGLSLDRIQIEARGHFMGSPAMAYVSISRGRTPEGIRIVGTPKLFAERVKIDNAVSRFI
jgi:hypothetical protein